MEGGGGVGGGKYLSLQNTFGVSGLNSIAAKSNVIEVKGAKLCHLHNVLTYTCPSKIGIVQWNILNWINIELNWIETLWIGID